MGLKHDYLWYSERMGSDAHYGGVLIFFEFLHSLGYEPDDVFDGDDKQFFDLMRRCFNESK